LANWRGPSPVNGAAQDDSDAVITPATPDHPVPADPSSRAKARMSGTASRRLAK
jgi:hypothetical protein